MAAPTKGNTMKKTIMSLSFIYLLSTALFAESETSGKVFFNHSTDLTEGGMNAFNIKRATYKLNDKLSILARLDQVDTDTSKNDDGAQAIIAGVHYSVAKGLTIAPTIRVRGPEEGDSENSIVLNFQFKF